MARIVVEDAVLFILMFYVICSVIFAMPILDSLTPGQRYNTTTSSFEPYTKTTTSILGDTTETTAMMEKYSNLTIIDAGSMVNPLAIVDMVRAYIGLFTTVVSSTMLYYVLKIFIGAPLAQIVSFILNLMIFIVSLRILSGRIRWD
jgi:hypothetical protein